MNMGSVEFDLRQYERQQAEGEKRMEIAEAHRQQLIDDFMGDRKNERAVMDSLADVAGGDSEFLHALQRGDVARIQKLLRDNVEFAWGDELVDKYAERLGEE